MLKPQDKRFKNLVLERQKLKAERDAADARIKEINGEVIEALAVAGEKTVQVDKWRVTFVSGCNVTVSKQKLLELGVRADIVEKATVRTEYETVQVTEVKEKS